MTFEDHTPDVASPTARVRAGEPAPAGGDPYVAAIREAMAAGWGLVVAGAHVRTAYEAARGCDRLGDVLLVHARPPAALSSYVGVEARRPPPDWGCGKWDRAPPNGLRVAGAGEMGRPGAVTLCLDAARPELVGPPIAAAMAAADPRPVLLVHAWQLRPGASKPGAPALVRLPEGVTPPGPAAAAFERFAASAELTAGPDHARLSGGGRTLLVQWLPPRERPSGGTRPEQPSIRVCEAEADGWLGYAEWRYAWADPPDLAAMAREAWLHGAHRFPSGEKVRTTTPVTGNVPWVGRRRDPGHAGADALLAATFGADAIALQEYLSDLAPARAVYRAAMAGDAARRVQYLRTWPIFREDLLDPAVAAAVDAGARVAPILAGRHGLATGTVRRLAGRGKPMLWAMAQTWGLPGAGAAALAAIGHDRLPARDDAEGWAAFDRVAVRFHEVLEAIGLRRRAAAEAFRWMGAMLAGIPGRDWPAREARVAALVERCHYMFARDMLRDLGGHLRALGVEGAGDALALRLFPGEPGFAGVLSASADWHDDPVLSLGSHGIGPDTAWEVPFDAADLGGGWRAVPLDSMAALVAEGGSGPDADGVRGLSHCVASYAPRCLRGESLIVSIRRDGPDGPERASTAELVHAGQSTWLIPGYEGRLLLVQHRGRGNAEPPKEAREALGRLRDELAGGTVPARLAAPGQAADAAVPGTAARQALALHPRWRGILPGRLGRLDAAGLAAHARAVAARTG